MYRELSSVTGSGMMWTHSAAHSPPKGELVDQAHVADVAKPRRAPPEGLLVLISGPTHDMGGAVSACVMAAHMVITCLMAQANSNVGEGRAPNDQGLPKGLATAPRCHFGDCLCHTLLQTQCPVPGTHLNDSQSTALASTAPNARRVQFCRWPCTQSKSQSTGFIVGRGSQGVQRVGSRCASRDQVRLVQGAAAALLTLFKS
jgi:hypothetical protein